MAKEKVVVAFYFVDRQKADELVAYGKKIGAGRDIVVRAPFKQDYYRESAGPEQQRQVRQGEEVDIGEEGAPGRVRRAGQQERDRDG